MNDSPQWRWRRWDVRADGKVFWGYKKSYTNGERWVDWGNALSLQDVARRSAKNRYHTGYGATSRHKYLQSDKGKKTRQKYLKCSVVQAKLKKWSQSSKRKAYQKSYKASQKYLNYKQSRRKSDPMYAMIGRLRCRIGIAIRKKGYSKTSKTREMLGCDWNHFMAHLEAKFIDGMTWGNRHLWHIDHITPLSSATSEEELIKLNHYTNLQPLWAEDNLRKGNRICANV